MTVVNTLLILTLPVLLLISEIPLLVKVGLVVLELLLVFITIGSAKMASAPMRLEIGVEGIQVFTRMERTWFPWQRLDRVEVMRVEGGPVHVVAWCAAANRFPEFNGFAARPRYLRRLGAVAICPLGVLRARRDLVVRALHAYGGNCVGKL